MQITQHQSSPVRWQSHSISSQEDGRISSSSMSKRLDQPLVFSLDDRLLEQHLTRLDLCSQNLEKLGNLPNNIQFNVILLDHNQLSKLEQLDIYQQLIQLSVSHNRLIDIRLCNRLRSIQKLNLSYNLIDSIDSLRSLQNLVMLNISNNHLHSLAVLNTCHALQSLDASNNSLQQIEDLSQLTSLKYFNLHKNFLDTLISVPRYWSKSLHTLVISDNEIQDLTDVAYLTSLINLNTLYMENNPCLSVVDERFGCHQPFDYRPYLLNWCLSIQNLDGIFVTRKESLKAEWLLSQGKGRAFAPGEHFELVEYLIRVCGTDAERRDELHLSRVILQQNLDNPSRQTGEIRITTSDTMNNSQNTQEPLRTSEADSHRIETASSTPTVEGGNTSVFQQHMRTPSPGYTRSTTASTIDIEDQVTETSSSYRYTNYDNRPIKPLDQTMLQTKLNQYPMNEQPNHIRTRRSHLAYNANRYSPKTTSRGPTASSTLYSKSTRNLIKQRHNRSKRQSSNSTNMNTSRLLSHSYERHTHHLTTAAVKVMTKEQQSSIHDTSHDNTSQHHEQDNQLKSTAMLSTGSTMLNNSIELQKLTTSVETMRTSVLQAYLDLHERFTKTTELQSSALTALWKKCDTQSLTHQQETERILEENRRLNQRISELESRLNTNQSKPINLHPPLRAHISKRDTKSFFLHWIPNPLNEHRTILGYRIYIDNVFKGAIDSGRFEAIIDYIRDEGEYQIKLRTYNEEGESPDSNVVLARFRRQHSIVSNSEVNTECHQSPLDDRMENLSVSPNNRKHGHTEQEENNRLITPEKQMTKSDEHIISSKTSPHLIVSENIVSRKPPKSPTSSPNRTDKQTAKYDSCSKVLFDNNTHSSSSTTRIGIRSRLAKSPHRFKRNNILLNALSSEVATSPPKENRLPTFQSDRITDDHKPIFIQQVLPITSTSTDTSNSTNINYLSSNSPPPPPIPPRLAKTMIKDSLDEQC